MKSNNQYLAQIWNKMYEFFPSVSHQKEEYPYNSQWIIPAIPNSSMANLGSHKLNISDLPPLQDHSPDEASSSKLSGSGALNPPVGLEGES
ncbi:hypothetical protein TNCT_113151 [Trichonephila clavata]|uniref:Uncharacterized protein n=1 Tax=Trichonephila clavata TaxID=2740835 RepID=A0A8X6G4C3_TRICU|nr:hypothetical protein TNCT_113151 [Trichonephila clavata]